jgi:[ribosomal protein S18]-alanine N-acetyltransferase
MKEIDIHAASGPEKDMAAQLLADSEPWITLRITPEKCKKNCHDPEFLLYIAYCGNNPSGIILLDPRGVAGSPYLKSLAIYPEFRGQGVGAALLSYAEDLFRSQARHMFLCVSSFNIRAQKFYKNCGYEVIGEFKDYIIEGESEILMHKLI